MEAEINSRFLEKPDDYYFRFVCELFDELNNSNIENREQFEYMLDMVFNKANIDERDLASDMGYNITSVRRWIRRLNTPHVSLWPRIIEWCKAALSEKVAEEEFRRHQADHNLRSAVG